jgi:hypothetical protein
MKDHYLVVRVMDSYGTFNEQLNAAFAKGYSLHSFQVGTTIDTTEELIHCCYTAVMELAPWSQ